jgi:hypothetical protein
VRRKVRSFDHLVKRWASMILKQPGCSARRALRFNSACCSRIWSAFIIPISVSQWTATWFPFFAASGSIVLMNAVNQWPKSEGFEVKLHPPGLDLGEVKYCR